MGANNANYAALSVDAFVTRLGHSKIRLRSDGEPSATALVAIIAEKRLKRGLQTIAETTPRYSSASLGAVGAAQRIVQGQTRTMRSAAEEEMSCKIAPLRIYYGRGWCGMQHGWWRCTTARATTAPRTRMQ